MYTFFLFLTLVALKADGDASGLIRGCSVGEGGMITCSFVTPPYTFFSPRGRIGSAVTARSGERIEIWWSGVFPRYELRYYRGPHHSGQRVGRCHYGMGCNRVFYEGPGTEKNGELESFSVLTWESYDFASPEGRGGHLERHRHVFYVSTGRRLVYRELLTYACGPPVSFYPDPCDTICNPPYQTRMEGEKEAPLLVSSEVILDEVLR
jgi:hypothetical protein